MDFKPEPIDTSMVRLPKALEGLLEQLARNAHDRWALQRISEGWVQGKHPDNAKKQHPDLVSFDQLTEAGKNSARLSASDTLKTLLVQGYEIVSPEATAVEKIQRAGEWKASIGKSTSTQLHQRWKQRGALGAYLDGDLYARFLKRSLDRDEFLLAIDIASEALDKLPAQDSKRLFLTQKRALAMAQIGAPDEARAILLQLVEEGHQDEDTLCGIGRTYKDEWLELPLTEAEKKNDKLSSAYLWYARSYLGPEQAARTLEQGDVADESVCPVGTYYSGINAATLALFLGFRRLSKTLAQLVRQQCEEKLLKAETWEYYWLEASLAEAHVLLGDEARARQVYRQATARGDVSRRDMLSSTRRQARLLAGHLFDGRTNYFDDCFPECSVVIFAGHLIDQPDSPFHRFPLSKIDWVSAAIAERLAQIDAGFGFSSAACGGDLLFLDAMLQRGADINILLPWPRDHFRSTSVEKYPGDWGGRFDRILEQAATVQEVANFRMPEDDDALSYDYCNHIMMGLAQMRARQLDLKLVPLVVWDGTDEWVGGTGSMVHFWHERNFPVEEIRLPRTAKFHSPGEKPAARLPRFAYPKQNVSISGGRRSLRALLFADVKGYSKLTETEILNFVKYFLRTISVLMARSVHSPIYNNTWGDAFYFVFNSVRDAGLFSIEFVKLVNETDWTLHGLPRNLNVRIGLHAGPVYESFDQVTRQITFSGSHVSTTARIEPITEPGKIYTTQEFASIAALENVREFRCQYVGQKAFAKNFGVRPIYLVKTVASSPV